MSTVMEIPQRDHAAQVAVALYQRLGRYFHQQAPQQQQISIRVDPPEAAAVAEGRSQRCDLAFVLPNGSRLPGALLARYLGGNMYELEAGVAGRTKRFTLCLPRPDHAGEDASGDRICDFLLDEIKRSAGERYLQEISRSCRPGSFELY